MLKYPSRAYFPWLVLFILTTMLAPTVFALEARPSAVRAPQKAATAPEIDPRFIYNQLDYMVSHFLKREAGYDNNLPASVNGHDEFANYWTQEMLSLLGNYGAEVHNDQFPLKGWRGRSTSEPGANIEVTVPGMLHPEQVVVIGCHYDGMAFSSQSANDDGSGCAIELGIAKAMSEFWSANHVYPDRTLRFVIFDAEEQGLYGSYHYVNSTVNGDLPNIVAMFNEEQNGIDYPLRYLGNMSNPIMPYYIDMTPLKSNDLYDLSKLTTQQRANIVQFRQFMQQAVSASFQEFRTMGYQMLTYHDGSGKDVWQPIFTPEQLSYIHLEDDTLGSSDQMPFTMAGLPCATLVGNSTYYDPNAPQASYPYDQPDDTIQLMNIFADGNSQQSQALTMALALPGMITSWMLSQSAILGQTSADGKPVATISSIGLSQPGQAMTFDGGASYYPAQKNSTLNYHWNFGDGAGATGQKVSHTYAKAGTYTLSLTISTTTGSMRTITKRLNIGQSTNYSNPYAQYLSSGEPPHNPVVTLPAATAGLSDQVGTTAQATQLGSITHSSDAVITPSSSFPLLWVLIGVIVLVVLIAVAGTLRWVWRK